MRRNESGNMIFFILLAIVLIGLVTAALRSGGLETANIDREDMIIKVSQVRQNAAELERALTLVMQNGISETAISFAADNPSASVDYGTYNTNAEAEIFNPLGGGALWREPPSGVNDGSFWEFYGETAVPDVGSDRADLVAVLPNVNALFCTEINRINGQTSQPLDNGACIHAGAAGRFVPAASPYAGTPNTMDGPFAVTPAPEACVSCAGAFHFYHVLMAR